MECMIKQMREKTGRKMKMKNKKKKMTNNPQPLAKKGNLENYDHSLISLIWHNGRKKIE